jgi:hypothetical protein
LGQMQTTGKIEYGLNNIREIVQSLTAVLSKELDQTLT